MPKVYTATYEKREALGIPMDYIYCRQCLAYCPPSSFTVDTRDKPCICDECVDLKTHKLPTKAVRQGKLLAEQYRHQHE
jgi:hypothetical protein